MDILDHATQVERLMNRHAAVVTVYLTGGHTLRGRLSLDNVYHNGGFFSIHTPDQGWVDTHISFLIACSEK